MIKSNKPPKIKLTQKATYIKINQSFDFVGFFKKVQQVYDECFLFESLGEESSSARYHLIGFEPEQIIWAKDKTTLCIYSRDSKQIQEYKCDISNKEQTPYTLLQDMMPKNIISKKYAGGLVGYLGYDSVNFFEPTINAKSSDFFEPFKFGLYKDGLVYDKMTGEIFYYYYDDNRYKMIQHLLKAPRCKDRVLDIEHLGDSMNEDEHKKNVNITKEHIKDGRIFQCEIGFKTKYNIKGDVFRIYEKLRIVNPSPHMYFMQFKKQKLIGASPELLLSLKNKEIQSFPLAGTTKRGVSQEEDTTLARELLNDKKEIAEHNMLVDLHRNDVGKIARFGSVKVRSLMDIRRYSHVQHISSQIVGLLECKKDMFDALAGVFPAGTLSGAPKIEAMKLINELESDGRGVYGGCVGEFSFNGNCTFAIAIRSLFINGDNAYVQTSGGNVYDSKASDEYIEIKRKLFAMAKVLGSFEDDKSKENQTKLHEHNQ
jgi:anthranilate synthase component 1